MARLADTGGLSAADRPQLQMDLADAGRDCRAATERMMDLHGASGFTNSNVLQWYWRDIAVAGRHPHLAVESYGTTLVERLDHSCASPGCRRPVRAEWPLQAATPGETSMPAARRSAVNATVVY